MTDPIFSDAEDALLRQAAGQKPDDAARFLRVLAKAFWKAGEKRKFAETFRRSYLEKPFATLERLAPDYPKVAAQDLRAMTAALVEHGVLYAPVIGNLAVAEAQLGNSDAVRRLIDYDRFLHCGVAALPAGADSDAFHDAVAAEIKSNLKFYDRPAGRAIRQGWRNNDVLRVETPALGALKKILQVEVDRYIAALPDDASHPFLAARPAQQRLDGWAVVSGPDSHHHPHVHSYAWITGVYYVTQPDISRSSQEGWLRVGPPRNRGVTEAAGWQTRMVEPARGSFVLMPGYFFHETAPMGVAQDRVCIAFETQYAELQGSAEDY